MFRGDASRRGARPATAPVASLLVAWESRVGATFQGRPSGDEDHVYVAALDNIVRAFDRAHGALRWKVALPERPASGPIVAGTTVFVPAVAAEVWAFNARTGARQGGVPVPERLAVVLERMLAKDPSGRFASAAGVVAALQPFAAGADLAALSPATSPGALVTA